MTNSIHDSRILSSRVRTRNIISSAENWKKSKQETRVLSAILQNADLLSTLSHQHFGLGNTIFVVVRHVRGLN